MEDLMGMLNKIMSDPEQMQQISSLASSLGLDSSVPEEGPKTVSPDPSTSSLFSSGDFSTLLPIFQKLQQSADDKYITFLRSLQPLLSDARKPKVDTAISFLKLISMLPYLEESGVLPQNNLLHSVSDLLKGVFL